MKVYLTIYVGLLMVFSSDVNGDKQAKQGRGRGSIWW